MTIKQIINYEYIIIQQTAVGDGGEVMTENNEEPQI